MKTSLVIMATVVLLLAGITAVAADKSNPVPTMIGNLVGIQTPTGVDVLFDLQNLTTAKRYVAASGTLTVLVVYTGFDAAGRWVNQRYEPYVASSQDEVYANYTRHINVSDFRDGGYCVYFDTGVINLSRPLPESTGCTYTNSCQKPQVFVSFKPDMITNSLTQQESETFKRANDGGYPPSVVVNYRTGTVTIMKGEPPSNAMLTEVSDIHEPTYSNSWLVAWALPAGANPYVDQFDEKYYGHTNGG